MAGLHFDITGDNSNFIRKLHECENGVKNASKQIEQSGLGIEDLFNRMTKAAAAFGAGFTAKELISNIAKVRGEFQQLEVAFRTMLGSEDKANALMQQLVKTAATTPFDLQGVANGAKQLLAYGENVENVNDDLIRLGNIAAGLSQPLGDIVYLYGTTMTQGRLYTQDLNQFTGRGIPMIRELAKVFGVAEGEVKSLVEAGKVGFPEVQKVIQNLTNEGGMFYNLMQEQSKTITGQISNIEDAISTMFNEIGKANEGIINDALSGVSYLVENYEKVGRILIEIVGTYGAYRTALMVTNALQALQASGITALTAKEAAHYGWLVLTKKAQDALNLSMLKNPYVLAAAAIAGLAYGIYKLATAESETEKAIRETNNALEAQKSHYDDLKNKAGELSNILSNESKSIEERFIAYRQLQRLMPEVFQNMDWETAKRKTNAELIKLETDEMLRQQRIGLKTKVVMSQQKVQGLENSIIRTTNRGGYTGALKEDLAAAKKELEIYTKALEDFEKADEQAKKESEKPVIFNKKYWEGQKKEAEDALNSIASSQKKLLDAGKFEGIDASVIKSYKDNTKKLKEAEKELKVYDSSSKRESAANKQKKEQQKTAEDLLSLRRQNQQAEIDLMKEGTEKKLKQIDLDYQKELDAIKKQEKDLSERQGGKLTSEQSIEISARYTNAENKREKDIADVSKELNSILDKYRDYSAQRIAIEKQYQDDKKKLRDGLAKAKSDSEKKQYEDALKELEKQRKKTIDSISKSEIEDSGVWKMLMGDVDALPTDMLEQLLSDAEQLVKTTNLSATDMKAMMDTINNARQNLIARNPFKTLKEEYEKYQKAIKKGDKQGAFTSWSNVEQASESIKSNISTLGSSLSSLGTTFSDELGEGIQKAVDIINDGITAFEVFGKTGEKSAGDTVKGISGIVGIITTLVGTVMNAFDSTKAEQERNIEYQRRQEGYWDSINYQVERYLELLKEAAGNDYFATATQSLTTLEKAREKAYRDIVKSMPVGDVDAVTFGLAQLFKSGKFVSKMTEYAFGGPQAKEIFDFIQANGGYDLQNKLISEEAIWAMKSNADIWSKLPEWMQQAIDKFVELNDQTKELEETLNEDLFQTTSQGLEEAILEGLKGGKRGIADFGEDFEEIMRNALLQSFVIDQLRGKAQEFYKKYTLLADSDENGKLDLTAEEISDLRKDWNDIIKAATEEAKNIDAIVGGSSSSSQEASKKGFATASQDSIDELNGRFTALQIAGEEIKNQMIAVVVGVNSLIGISSAGNETLSNILNQHVITNSYLEDITKYTKLLNDIRADISEVKVNTKGLSTR